MIIAKTSLINRFLFAHSQIGQFFVCTSLFKKLLTIKVSRTIDFGRFGRNSKHEYFKIALINRFSFTVFIHTQKRSIFCLHTFMSN